MVDAQLRAAFYRSASARRAGRAAATGFAAAGASVVLAWLAQTSASRPGPVTTLLSSAAILTYLGGITTLCTALIGACGRHPALTAAAWASALVAARLALDPRVALAAVGRVPNGLLQDWLALSRSELWIAAVPLELVIAAAACGALALSLRAPGPAVTAAARSAAPREVQP